MENEAGVATPYITVTEAREKAEVTRVTIITWCREYGIGVKVGGRWRVDPIELGFILDGSMHSSLARKEKEIQ